MPERDEVRCYGHVFDPAHRPGPHAPTPGWPAHTWSSSPPGQCQQCPRPVAIGDRYVCIDTGVIHVECIAALDADVTGDRP